MSAVLESPRVNFRPMAADDLDEVMAIERAAYRFPWGRGIFEDCLRVGYIAWVMHREETLTGYGVMSVAAGESHVLNLCVRPECQGRGYGGMLLEHLLRMAARFRAEVVLLEVRPSNRAAVRLYLSKGFSEVGVRRKYYPGDKGREDALILARDLLVDQEASRSGQ